METKTRAVLAKVGEASGPIATHWMNAAAETQSTAKTRRLLKRLERDGFVEPVPSSRSGLVFWWKITDLGRFALSQSATGADQ